MSFDVNRIPRTLHLEASLGHAMLHYVDQRLLPGELRVAKTADWLQVIDAIKMLAVRGAPALGVAGAAALALWAVRQPATDDLAALESAADLIAQARPTAVNLEWGVRRAVEVARNVAPQERAAKLCDFVNALEVEDEACNRAIGAHGAALLPDGARVLTHCNAGSLATCFYGTALGVVYAAAEQGKIERVFADETRPVGQGSRLTAWELARAGVPVTLICDNMAASLMAHSKVDAVIVGADRITANGDVANKIGTYGLALLAEKHHIPFYVAAPTSTIDLSLPNGSSIPIEQRAAQEVLPQPIEGVDVWNPAFDVTPARFITSIITDQGVFDASDIRNFMQN